MFVHREKKEKLLLLVIQSVLFARRWRNPNENKGPQVPSLCLCKVPLRACAFHSSVSFCTCIHALLGVHPLSKIQVFGRKCPHAHGVKSCHVSAPVLVHNESCFGTITPVKRRQKKEEGHGNPVFSLVLFL
jgi:hypothetical protein